MTLQTQPCNCCSINTDLPTAAAHTEVPDLELVMFQKPNAADQQTKSWKDAGRGESPSLTAEKARTDPFLFAELGKMVSNWESLG